jgi:transposase
VVQPPNEPEAGPAGLDIPPADWQQTPPSVKTLVMGLLKRLEALEARLNQDATTSHRPPSTNSPYKKRRSPSGSSSSRKAGGQPGHPGHRQRLLVPTDTQVVIPVQCACGNPALSMPRPYYTHQVIELPPIHMDMTHFGLRVAIAT